MLLSFIQELRGWTPAPANRLQPAYSLRAYRCIRQALWGAVLLFSGGLSAQDLSADSFQLTLQLPVAPSVAAADHLGQLYLITPGNILEKYAAEGRLLARYSNNRLGPAAALDVSNPLKILVWYAAFRTLVFLDRNLTELGVLNLASSDFSNVQTVATAADGNLWLYDDAAFRLYKIAPDGTRLFESAALNQIENTRLNLNCIRDNGHEVLAADPEQGLWIFDVYGQVQKRLPMTGIETFQLFDDRFIYVADRTLHITYLKPRPDRIVALPDTIAAAGARLWPSPDGVLAGKGRTLQVWKFAGKKN